MNNSRRKVRAATIAAGVALLLGAAKLAVSLVTGSLAVLAAAVDSFMDLLCSGLNAYFLRLAADPPDAEHAYGHGKAEALSGVIQAVIVAMGGVWLVVRGSWRLAVPEPVASPEAGVVVSVVALAITAVLVVFLRHEARATQSIALRADTFHYLTDLGTNLAAALALAGYRFLGWSFLDPLASLFIALYILKSAVEILRGAAEELLDRGLPREVEEEVQRMLVGFAPEVRGYRDFRSRTAGGQRFFEFRLLVDRGTSFQRSHELSETAIRHIRERHGEDTQVMVDTDPV